MIIFRHKTVFFCSHTVKKNFFWKWNCCDVKKSFFWTKIQSYKRIGPHSEKIISLFIGNLLGDGHASFQNHSTRFMYHISEKHKEYAFWIHNELCVH